MKSTSEIRKKLAAAEPRHPKDRSRTIKNRCECCEQPGDLAPFPAPLPVGGVTEVLMCEACRNGNPLERFLELVMVPTGVLQIIGKTRNGKNIYKKVGRYN
jgi:hypothetical protein